MKFKYLLFGYLALALIGIGVLINVWLSGGYSLAGHDSGLAISAGDFFKTRLFAWDIQDFGYDNSPHFGSLILHGIDYLTAIISGASYAGNQVNVFLWFALIFTSSFLFTYKLKDRLGEWAPVFFPVFVTFNFFILQSIFILERAKYSILIALLIVTYYVVRIAEKKLNLIVAAIFTSISLTIFNSGSWLGLPLYGGLFVLVLSAVIFEILWGFRNKNFVGLKRLIIYFFLTAVGFILLNAYSIVPYLATFFKQDYSNLVSENIITINKSWLESLSQAGSFSNFFRLQGVPDWYSGSFGINTSHSYASIYLANPGLILVSLIFSILAFWSLALAKDESEKRAVSFLGLTVLVSMVFMAGSHEPFGKIYELLFTHLPGFAIFRSPYFKFASTFFIAISAMIAFTLSKLIVDTTSKITLERKLFVSLFLSAIVLFGWLFYHNPIFSPNKIFEWQAGYSTRMKIPNYIGEFPKEFEKINVGEEKILLIPALNPVWGNDSYSWGYWSLTNLPSTLVNKSFLTNDSGLSKEERGWVNFLYSQIKEGNESKFLEAARRLGVGYLLLRNDVASDPSSWSGQEDPRLYEKILSNFKTINKISSFGEWDLYKIDLAESNIVGTKESLVFIPSESSYLNRVFIGDDSALVASVLPPYLEPFINKKLGIYNCQSCLLETKKPKDFLPTIRILPNSKLYYFKAYKENKTLKNTRSDSEKVNAYLGFLLRRSAETMSMINNWAREEEIASNMKTMNDYLDSLQDILTTTSDGEKDFITASQIVDSLGPIEINFQAFTKRDDFGKKGEDFREQMLGVLWRIYNIKKFYSPILANIEKWEREKVYYVTLNSSGAFDFYIDLKSLPTDLNGKPIIPSKIEFVLFDKTESISTSEENGWLKFTLNVAAPGSGKLTLYFDELPNLFDSFKESLVPLPAGEKSCISGKIKNFKPHVPYRILVQSNNMNETLKLIIKDDSESVSSGNMFLHGENEVTVEQNSVREPFGFLYHPETGGVDPAIFLCSPSKDAPDIGYVKVVEITTPPLVFADVHSTLSVLGPEIKYEKINNTKYVVKVSDAPNSYILTFNQRYNPFWKLYVAGQEISKDQHFMIDGYANGWRVDKGGSYEITLEYSIQRLLYLGFGISASAFIVFLAFLLKRNKLLNKNK